MDTDSTRWLKLRSGSDIRGRVDALTDEVCERVGYAFACMLAERLRTTPDKLAIAVGRDDRPSGKRIKAALIRGVTAADSDVLDCGTCAAPALFTTLQEGQEPAHGAVMVTAWIADPEVNGFKLMTAAGGLQGADVASILRRAAVTEVPERLVKRYDATARHRAALRLAAQRWLEDDALKPLLGMKVIVDARDSIGADYAQFLDELGVDTADSLRPSPASDAAELADAVVAHRADLGVAFSPDADHAFLVDADGAPLNGNRLIALIAALLLDQAPGATIVTDSATSTGLSAFIAEWGGVHYRFKRGYRNVIDEAERLNREGIDCPLAIETSGHAAFRENDFLDDGMYLATRIICEALNRKREGLTLSALIDDLREPVEKAEIRLSILDFEDWEPEEEAQEIVEILLSHTLDHPEWQMAPDSREGVRITFNLDGGVNNAWFQLRMSVHDPVMVLSAESDVPGGVKRVLNELYALIRDTALLDLEPLKNAISE